MVKVLAIKAKLMLANLVISIITFISNENSLRKKF